MPPKQDNVQRLLAAEEKRNHIISDAKARKQQKVKQAKTDAEKDVSIFRQEKDSEYEQYKRTQLNGADSEHAQLTTETDAALKSMEKLTAERIDLVAKMMANMVVSVKVAQ